MTRRILMLVSLMAAAGCGTERPARAPAAGPTSPASNDGAHANVVGPHGDHTPRRGGMVLMNGDVHYEVVLRSNGKHEVWFSEPCAVSCPRRLPPR